MRILYIVPFVPWEIRVRSLNLIPRLAQRHDIFLICVSNTAMTRQQAHWLERHCRRTKHVWHSRWKGLAQSLLALPTETPMRMAFARSRAAREAVRQMYEIARPHVVYVERWRGLDFLPENLDVPLICDPTDSMTLYNQRLMQAGLWWEKLVGWEEHGKFSRAEGNLARLADVVVFCSQLDLECVRRQAPEVRYALVPNGVDCHQYRFKQPGEEDPDLIVFTGSLKYRPNVHAVEFFLEEIFPRVRQAVPQARFLAVGNGAGAALKRYCGAAQVSVLDFVSHLRPYLAQAAVSVAPLTLGAGVSNKIGEGFAVGTPVVATALACGDLRVASGRELLIASDPAEFAAHVARLLTKPGLRRQIASQARKFIEKYDWAVVAQQMEELMEQVAASPAGKQPAAPSALEAMVPAASSRQL